MTNERQISDETLRKLVIGTLPEEERDLLEEQLFEDDELLGRALESEDDLIDAYSGGTATPEERRLTEERAARDPRFWRRVQIARALSVGIERNLNVVPFERPGGQRARRVRYFAAAAMMGPIIVTAMWLNRSEGQPQSSSQVATIQKPQADVKRRTGPRAVAPPAAVKVATATLAMMTVRGDETRSVIDLAGADRLQLTIQVDPAETYKSFRVRVLDRTEREVFTSDAQREGDALTIELPASAITGGRYEIVVAGRDGGKSEELAFLPVELRK